MGVVLAHPPDIELVLRKRICLRVYKRMGIGATLLRAYGTKVSANLLLINPFMIFLMIRTFAQHVV